MGLRLRRTIRLAPGVRVNLSKTGASLSLGGRGASLNLGRRGPRATVGLPGSGISYSEALPVGPGASRALGWAAAAILALGIVVFLL